MSFPCIVVDESVDTRICSALQKDGYNLYYIAAHHTCVDDIKIIEVAVIKEAMILTEDKDLGRFIAQRKNLHKGTLLLQLAGLTTAEKKSHIFNAFLNHKYDIINSFTILTPQKLTIKKYFL